MNLDEALELLAENGYDTILNEDFGIGVGGPAGLDQGIPHGGDCKGCCPQRMGLFQRSPFSINPLYKGVPDAHHPGYWLNQIPKKRRKKKKRKKVHAVNEGLFDFITRDRGASLEEMLWYLYLKTYGKDDLKYFPEKTEDSLKHEFMDSLHFDPSTWKQATRVTAAGHMAKRMIDYNHGDYAKTIKSFKHELRYYKDANL